MVTSGHTFTRGERKSSNTSEGNEGSSPRFHIKLDSIGEESVSFFNELDTGKEPCSWGPVSFLHKLETEGKLCL